MARAGRGKFVGINKETSVRITGINRNHSMVNVFLSAFALVAWSKETTSRVRCLTSLQTSSLCVVILAIAIFFGDVLEDDSPETFDVNCSTDFRVANIRWTQVTLGSNPMSGVIWRFSFGSTGVIGVIKCSFLWGCNMLDKIISIIE
jgi:hypothetical protein